MWKVLGLVAFVIGFVVALVDPSGGFVMDPLDWFVLGIGLTLLTGLSPSTARTP